jgi:hypothetical protein
MGEPLVAISTSEGARGLGGDDPGGAWGRSASFRRLCYRRGVAIASGFFLALCVLMGPAAAITAQVDAARLDRADQDAVN